MKDLGFIENLMRYKYVIRTNLYFHNLTINQLIRVA